MADKEFAKPWLEFDRQVGGLPLLYGPTLEDVFMAQRKLEHVLQASLTFPAPDESVKTENKKISPEVTVRIYTPPNYAGNQVVGLYIHGGGFCMGDLDGEDGECRRYSKSVGVVLVAVDYRLAPAHRYPAGLNDCLTAYRWALEESSYLKTIPNRAFIIGASAGGGLAISTALQLVDAGEADTLEGLIAILPVTLHPDACPPALKSQYTSYEEHAEHTIDTPSAMKAFLDAYGAPPFDPYLSVLLHKRLKDLPRTYIVAAGCDTLRDDARLFRAALTQAGVPTLFDEHEGYPHWFWAFPSEHLVDAVEAYWERLLKGTDFVLSGIRAERM